MKKLTFTIVLILSQIILLAQTKDACLPLGITFTTQEQIDNFTTNYPDCTEIEGNVTIVGSNITNLNGLNVLTSIGSVLTIYYNDALTNLTGLESLTSVGGNLTIGGNNVLTSLTGLEGLNTIGGSLNIGWYDWLEIYGNPSLTSLAGLDNLTSIGYNLVIMYADSLTNLSGLESLTSVGESLTITANSALTSLTGLEGLNTIGGSLIIGLFDGLGGGYGNSSLASIAGLESVNAIGGDLTISKTWLLTSLSGLENVEAGSITDLNITDNYFLSECHVLSVCNYLANPNGAIEIHDNAEGCNDTAQINAACLGVSIEEIKDEHDFVISPNPINGFATLNYNTNQMGTDIIEIYNTLGSRLQSRQIKLDKSGQQHLVLDFTGFSSGIYFCHLQVGSKVIVKKIVKK